MTRSALVLLLSIVALPALAQRAQLGFSALDLSAGATLEGHAVLERSAQNACSRSYASSSGRASLELRVDRSGASMVLDGRSDSTTGSHDGDSSHTFHLHRVELTGTVARSGETLVVHFTSAASGTGWWEGYGTAPPPALTTAPVDVTLSCSISAEDVLPAEWSEGETPTRERLLRCELTLGSLPTAFDSYGEAPLVFGAGEAVRTVMEEGRFTVHDGRTLRRAP